MLSRGGEELVVISGYDHFGCCFYVYCFIWLMLVNVPIFTKNYLAIVDFHFIRYLSNPSNYFCATMSNEPNTRLSGIKQDIWSKRTEFTQSLTAVHGSMDEKF